MKFNIAITLFFASAFSVKPIYAAEIGIASFNLAWAGTANQFKKHVEVCTAVKWCDVRKDAACQSKVLSASGGKAQSMMVAPCNAYGLTEKKIEKGGLKLYDQKLEGLMNTIDELIIKHHIDVFAFQEVKDEETVKTIFGNHLKDFDICVAPHNAFQTVAFAWKKSASSSTPLCKTESTLSISEITDSERRLRPGLELTLSVNGKKITFLNIHLKSSCANFKTGGGFPGRKLTDDEPACKLLNQQVAPLENWIEVVSKQSPDFLILGDFNRKIDEEASSRVTTDEIRSDGSDPRGPNPADENGHVKTDLLWQEISDGDPGLTQIPLSKFEGCTGFKGLDHIVLSAFLFEKQLPSITSSKVPVVTQPAQIIKTSDHCPQIVEINI